MKILAVVAMSLISGVLVYVLDCQQRRKTTRKLAQREALDDAAIYRQFYVALLLPEADMIELWREVADTLPNTITGADACTSCSRTGRAVEPDELKIEWRAPWCR